MCWLSNYTSCLKWFVVLPRSLKPKRSNAHPCPWVGDFLWFKYSWIRLMGSWRRRGIIGGGWNRSECYSITFWCMVRGCLPVLLYKKEGGSWVILGEGTPYPQKVGIGTLILGRAPELWQVPASPVATSFPHNRGRYQQFPHELRHSLGMLL